MRRSRVTFARRATRAGDMLSVRELSRSDQLHSIYNKVIGDGRPSLAMTYLWRNNAFCHHNRRLRHDVGTNLEGILCPVSGFS